MHKNDIDVVIKWYQNFPEYARPIIDGTSEYFPTIAI